MTVEDINVINEKPHNIFREIGDIGRKPDLLRFFIDDVIGKRVKMDYPTKISCFCAGLSAYTPEPMNVFLKEESSSGKTYNAVNSLNMFPEEDVWALGGLSPTALTHLYGTLYDSNDEEIREEDRPQKEDYKEQKEFREDLKKWRERLRTSYSLIVLSGKILLFLEAPHIRTFQMMYPILSHDKKQVEYKITDKSPRGQLVTSHIIIQGWPATVFCTTSDKTVEELATRCFTTSPQRLPEKYRAAHGVSALKNEAPWVLDEWHDEERTVRLFINHYKEQMKEIAGICNPFSRMLAEHYPAEIRRDMRDFPHFLRIIKALTGLHFAQRPQITRQGKRYIVTTPSDIENARNLFNEIFESTRSGISQHKLDFHFDIIVTRETWTGKELTREYNALYPMKRSSKTITRYLDELSDAGYVDTQPNPEDKRQNIYKPLIKMRTNMDICKEGVISASDYEKTLKEWLNRYGQNTQYYVYNSAKLKETTINEFQDFTLSIKNPLFCPYLNNDEEAPEIETEPENTPNPEMSLIVHNSSNADTLNHTSETTLTPLMDTVKDRIITNINDQPCAICREIPEQLYPDVNEEYWVCKSCLQEQLAISKIDVEKNHLAHTHVTLTEAS